MGKLTQFVHIKEHHTKGKILVANQALHAGLTILREQPIIIAPEDPMEWPNAFLEAPPSVQAQALQLYSPVDGPNAARVRAALLPKRGSPLAAAEWLSHRTEGVMDAELSAKITMVFHFNGVDVSPIQADGSSAYLGVGLYNFACRASHSCTPNCFWYAGQDGSRVLRTLAAVEAEEEVTVDYCGRGFLYQPTCMRRAKLQSSYEFACDCSRCASSPSGGDDTRRFPCSQKRGGGSGVGGCAGYHLVQQLDVGDAALLLPCSSCGHVASASARADLLDNEAELLARLDRVDATRELRLVRALRPPHPHHAAAARIGMLQWELFHRTPGMCDVREAARAAREAIACLQAIRPLPSKEHAVAYLALGDSLLRGIRMGGAPSPLLLLVQAQEAYRKGVRAMMLLYGPSHPSSEAAARSLAAVQCSMLPEDASASVGATKEAEAGEGACCSFCGGATFESLLQCRVCRVAAYCCEEHRRAQWPLHKKTCRAPELALG